MEKTPHVHAELIKAWADDPSIEIQFYQTVYEEWMDVPGNDPLWEEDVLYRVKPEEEEITFCTGQRFTDALSPNEEYILALVDYEKVTLVSLVSGNRWANPVKVGDHQNITKYEWGKITVGERFILKKD